MRLKNQLVQFCLFHTTNLVFTHHQLLKIFQYARAAAYDIMHVYWDTETLDSRVKWLYKEIYIINIKYSYAKCCLYLKTINTPICKCSFVRCYCLVIVH